MIYLHNVHCSSLVTIKKYKGIDEVIVNEGWDWKNRELPQGKHIIVHRVGNSHMEDMLDFFDVYGDRRDYKFVLYVLTDEDYIINPGYHMLQRQQKIYEYTNVKIVSDFKYDNRVEFRLYNYIDAYLSQLKFFISFYILGKHNYDMMYHKRYRMGIHFGKVHTMERPDIMKRFLNHNYEKLWITALQHHDSNVFTKEERNIIENKFHNNDWIYEPFRDVDNIFNNRCYLSNIEMCLQSQIEAVYETSMDGPQRDVSTGPQYRKLNEKSLKHALLMKPFIHTSPHSHKIWKDYGFIPYKPLYRSDIWDVWEGDSVDLGNSGHWQSAQLISDNIEWLMGMSDEKFNSILMECEDILLMNRKIVETEAEKDIVSDLVSLFEGIDDDNIIPKIERI